MKLIKICDAFQTDKQVKSFFKYKNHIQPLYHWNYCILISPTRTISLGEKRCALVIVDDYS